MGSWKQNRKRTALHLKCAAEPCGWCKTILGDYPSEWAAICSIASKIGCTTETLRNWIRQG
jgi:cytidine deaminase